MFIFTHPYVAGALPPDLGCYYLGNLAGLPFDTALMAAHLMFSGALDELPSLNIILAHGGGHLPYQIGRLDHGYRVRKEARASTRSSPLALLRRFHFDALTHDADALRFLVEKAGAESRDYRHRCPVRHGRGQSGCHGQRSARADCQAARAHSRLERARAAW